MKVAELIGTASVSKDGLMSSVDYVNNTITVGNEGSSSDRTYEIKNYNNDKCLVSLIARTNDNVMNSAIVAFNIKSHSVLVKTETYYNNLFYKDEDGGRRYFIRPTTSYGTVEIRFLNGRNKIEMVEVSDTIIYSELKSIA